MSELRDGYWTIENCQADALKFNTRKNWKKHSSSAYDAAAKNGWLDKCSAHMQTKVQTNNYWTVEKCQAEAKKM